MPATPWKPLLQAEPEREYLVLLTFLPMRRVLRLPQFLRYVRRIQKQLDRTDGLLGYSLLARPLRSKYWTLSVWESDEALSGFIRERPHRDAMVDLPNYLSGFRTTRWMLPGSALPPRWTDALARS
jgi:hypothetical protein